MLSGDQVLSLWRVKVELVQGEVDWLDLQTMRDALALYQQLWHYQTGQELRLEEFAMFVAEEVQGSPDEGCSFQESLRAAVARNLEPLHRLLQELCSGECPACGAAGLVDPQVLGRSIAALFAVYSGGGGAPPVEDVIFELLRDSPVVVGGEGKVDLWEALFRLLGRRRAPVELVLYDISQGALRLFSPLLFGKSFEAIYHSSVLVHGTEYWYGGNLFENEPPIDRRVFGSPLGNSVEHLAPSAYKPELRVVRLGYTLASKRELRSFLHKEMKPRYTPANYDVLAHNCNHFSDQVVHFLTGAHIPESISKLPELLMDTPTARLLRPFLNRWLRGFQSMSGPTSPGHRVRDEDSDGELRIWDEGVIEGGEVDLGYFDPVISAAHRRRDARRECVRKEISGQLCWVKAGVVLPMVSKSEEAKRQRREVRRAAVKRLGDGELVDARAL